MESVVQYPVNKEEPAYSIIHKLGGVGIVAKHVGSTRSHIYLWVTPKGKGRGTGGRIPLKQWHKLLDLARQRGVELSAAELLGLKRD